MFATLVDAAEALLDLGYDVEATDVLRAAGALRERLDGTG